MKYFNTLDELSASFVAKEHSIALGNSEECHMFSHIHPSAELLLVISGKISLTFFGEEPEDIIGGCCALVFPFQPHQYDREAGTEYFRFNFSPSLLQSFFAPNANNIGDRACFPINLAEYMPFFDLIRAGEISFFKVKGFLYNIIGDYCRSVSLSEKHVDSSILNKVIAYVDEHKAERLTLASTAAALGYNPKYLSRSINRAAGFGFSTLLSTLRMESARHLLKNTQRTVVDIAISCGFGSERNFYRAFKDLTGYTPNEYRSSAYEKIVINDCVL